MAKGRNPKRRVARARKVPKAVIAMSIVTVKPLLLHLQTKALPIAMPRIKISLKSKMMAMTMSYHTMATQRTKRVPTMETMMRAITRLTFMTDMTMVPTMTLTITTKLTTKLTTINKTPVFNCLMTPTCLITLRIVCFESSVIFEK